MPPGLSKSSEKGGNNVNTGVSITDNQLGGSSSGENRQSMGANQNSNQSLERELVVGDKCKYCGKDPNSQKQYSGVLTVAELGHGKVTLTKADGSYTTWLNQSDLRLL